MVGPGRKPSMADRPSMPYTDAVIHEIQRMGNIVPLNGLRRAGKDTTLAGYFIPKVQGSENQVDLQIVQCMYRSESIICVYVYVYVQGTTLMPNLTSVLFDKTEWETPDIFNPAHFLDADGKLVRRDAFLPFSAGDSSSNPSQELQMISI